MLSTLEKSIHKLLVSKGECVEITLKKIESTRFYTVNVRQLKQFNFYDYDYFYPVLLYNILSSFIDQSYYNGKYTLFLMNYANWIKNGFSMKHTVPFINCVIHESMLEIIQYRLYKIENVLPVYLSSIRDLINTSNKTPEFRDMLSSSLVSGRVNALNLINVFINKTNKISNFEKYFSGTTIEVMKSSQIANNFLITFLPVQKRSIRVTSATEVFWEINNFLTMRGDHELFRKFT